MDFFENHAMYGALLTAATGACCSKAQVAGAHHSAAILILEVKSHVSEWSLWSGHQCVWMFADNECADRLGGQGCRNAPALRVDHSEKLEESGA